MRIRLMALAVTALLLSCNNEADSSSSSDSKAGNTQVDTGTTHYPDGITTGSVTSTDTAAMTLDSVGQK